MILIGGLGMLVMFGMPKIMENSESALPVIMLPDLLLMLPALVDPEMREEFEKSQRSNALANTLTGSGGGGFDAAAWLAGSNPDGQGSTAKSTSNELRGNSGGGKPRRRG